MDATTRYGGTTKTAGGLGEVGGVAREYLQ